MSKRSMWTVCRLILYYGIMPYTYVRREASDPYSSNVGGLHNCECARSLRSLRSLRRVWPRWGTRSRSRTRITLEGEEHLGAQVSYTPLKPETWQIAVICDHLVG